MGNFNIEHKEAISNSPAKAVKYNPNKTHFEQHLEYLGFKGNPDISFEDLKKLNIELLKKTKPVLHSQDIESFLEKMSRLHPDMSTYKKYIRDGKKNYKIAKEFSDALANTPLDMTCKYMPKQDTSYNIQFHKDVILASLFGEKDVAYRNCYVNMEDCTTEYDIKKGYLKKIMLIFPTYIKGESYYTSFDFVNLVFREDNQKVTEALEESARESDSKNFTDVGRDIIKFVTNIILYINSGDPDLRHLSKPKLSKKAKDIVKFERKNKHKTLLDIIEVGFNYMKGIRYRVSSTVVRGHFRWQPFGHGREQIKLIWIDEHPRTFNKIS